VDQINEVPELSDGAQALLRIAIQNDSQNAIANNAAFFVALDWLKRLRIACQDESDDRLRLLMHSERLPDSFLEIVCTVLARIHLELNARLRDSDSTPGLPIATDFDRHVLQAFAETLADAAWPDRAAKDFDGPSTAQVRQRLKKTELAFLYRAFLRNYVGNILNDLFAATQVRQSVRDLDPDTEVKLRSEDAAILVDWVMQQTSSSDPEPEPRHLAACLASSLRQALR
jgi:hypothetical protein